MFDSNELRMLWMSRFTPGPSKLSDLHDSEGCVDCVERVPIHRAPRAPQLYLSMLLGIARVMNFVLFSIFNCAESTKQEIICDDVKVF